MASNIYKKYQNLGNIPGSDSGTMQIPLGVMKDFFICYSMFKYSFF